MTIGSAVGGAGGAGVGALSADEGQRLRGALVGGGTGALMGASLGALAGKGDMIPRIAADRSVKSARLEGYELGAQHLDRVAQQAYEAGMQAAKGVT